MACIVASAIPRRRSFDASGNIIPFPDETSWLGLFHLVAPGLAFISAIWTVSTGFSLMVKHLRHQHTRSQLAGDDDNTMTIRD